jgi:hypothetical protein
MASMEVVLAIAESAREHKQVMLSRQVPAF